MAPTNRFLCPVGDCDWQHDEPLFEPPADLHADVELLAKQRMEEVEGILRGHFETHTLDQWAQTVSDLHAQLQQQPQQLLCLACVVAQHKARQAGVADDELPGINPAVVIGNGNGICLGHLQISDGPVMGDRTASGIVLPGNASRMNGSNN